MSVVCIKIYLFLLPPRFIQKLPFSSHLRRLPSFLYNLFPPQRSASLIPNHTTSVRLSFNHPNQTSFHQSTPSVKQSPPLYENLSFVTCSPSHACSTADQASSSSTSGRLSVSVATRERDVCGGTSFVLVFALILSQIDDLHRGAVHNKSSRMTTSDRPRYFSNPYISPSRTYALAKIQLYYIFDDSYGLIDRIGFTFPAACAPRCANAALSFHYPRCQPSSQDSRWDRGPNRHDTKDARAMRPSTRLSHYD